MVTKQKKSKLLDELRELWKNSAGVIFSDTQLLDATATQEFRAEIHKAGIVHKVFKNTLIAIVAKEMGAKDLEKHLIGPTACTFAKDDSPVAARLIVDFSKKYPKKYSIKAGFSEGILLGVDGIVTLSQTPSRPQLLGMLAFALNGPILSLARVLNGNIEGLARVLNAVRNQKEKAA